MLCQAFLPSPPLQHLVVGYQLRHFVFDQIGNHPFKPYAARPEQVMAFLIRGSEKLEHPSKGVLIERPRSYLAGQYTERTNRHLPSPETIVLLINFHPGVLHRLTSIAFHRVTNTFVDAEDILPCELRNVNDRLSSAESYTEMIAIIETFLLGWCRRISGSETPVDKITNALLSHPEDMRVWKMATNSFLSMRQFERRFKERNGISPNTFLRIARMHKALKTKYRNPAFDWLDVALMCGYHDYQHLARDFRALAGALPNEYMGQEMHAPEKYFGLSDSSL